MSENKKYTNALAEESSPYLLQHAHNPVDWMPWGEDAFEQAKNENKLVLVSIGYSACHWCHVMERETFEDEEAAKVMNEHFVCVKVDREEHPEVDQVYMSAVQLMTQSGGWPLNCFALPDGRPVYGGTYFPKEQWMHVMDALVKLKTEDLEKMEKYAEKLQRGVAQVDLVEKSEEESPFENGQLRSLVLNWSNSWDRQKGGPNRAPKFPMPNNYQFLLDYSFYQDEEQVLNYVKTTLNEMCRGGIYDQVGGGFARYSVDPEWKVPHFEKMLYDNAQLVSLYSSAFQLTGEREYGRVVKETLDFIEREMTDESGLFYSGLDADSEGVEGKFYTWKKQELEEILEEDFPFVRDYFGVDARGYWENDVYILLRSVSDVDFAEKKNITPDKLYEKVDRIKKTLLQERAKRIRPGLDDKMLTSWNAMMISGLVAAAKAFPKSNYREKAVRAAEQIWSSRFVDGELVRSFKSKDKSIPGSLEDYAFTIEAFLDLYEIAFDGDWLQRAKSLAEMTIEKFEGENGMFWFSADQSELLFAKKQEVMDNVIPATNSSLAKSFFRLGHFFSDEKYIVKSRQMLSNTVPVMRHGSAFSNWAQLLQWFANPFFEVVVSGPNSAKNLEKLNSLFLPGKILLFADRSTDLRLLKGKHKPDEDTIYVCVDKTCKSPVSSVEDALEEMNR
ncbi:thioredoxin domain-containing protein [Halocola ammonii]